MRRTAKAGLKFALVMTLIASGCSSDDKKKLGEPCSAPGDCADQVCHRAICVAKDPLRIGDPCTKDAECRSLKCNGKCERGTQKAGDACRFDVECLAGGCKIQGSLPGLCALETIKPDAGVDAAQPDALPDVAVADTVAPDTVAPDTVAPDTVTPDTVAPDTVAPDTISSDASACPVGTKCNDNDPCTKDDTCDSKSACVGTTYSCSPNACQWTSVCDGKGGCTINPKGAGGTCEDGDACTLGDKCDGAGKCAPGPVCDQPPASSCVNKTTVKTCTGAGKCVSNKCEYTCSNSACGGYQSCTTGSCSACNWVLGGVQVSTIYSDGGLENGDLAIDPAGKLHAAFWWNYKWATPPAYRRLLTATDATGSWAYRWITTSAAKVHQGAWASIEVDNTGNEHISYYDATNGDLKYRVGSGATWTVQTADAVNTTKDVGQYTSLKLDSANKVHIAYYNKSDGELWYTTNASGSWVPTRVDGLFADVGSYASLVLDKNGKAHISYYDATNKSLKVANNLSGSWAVAEIVAKGAYVEAGRFTSIGIDSAQKLHISYYVYTKKMPTYTTGTVRYVTNASGSWVNTDVETFGDLLGTSLFLDKKDKVHIAYGSVSLHYATNASGSWRAQTVTSTTTLRGGFPALVIDNTGKVHITEGVGDARQNPHYGGRAFPSDGMKHVSFLTGCP